MFNMKIKSALLVVGYFLVLWGSGSSQVVPDGLVYTELEKTLVQGSRGILTCRFYKDPVAVFWKRGPNPDDSSFMLLWHEGTVSGPKYDDGTYDIDVNSYSLIIKNVSKADTGRFYCRVSNYQGILIRNYTDVIVVDSALETKSHLTLQMRPKLPGILQCTVHIRPKTVTWTERGITSSSDKTLVTLENNGTVISRSGAGYHQGRVNISKEFSLVINDVQVQNEGLYVCEVTDFDTGITFRADTLVNVAASPLEPFPSILECPQDSSDPGYCSLLVNAETTLTCYVREYYPDINLQFFHGSEAVEKVLNTSKINNTDGTKSKSLEIAASESKKLYTCVAFNIPGTLGNVSTSVLLHGHDRDENFKTTVLVILVILLASVMLIVSVICTIRRKRRLNKNTNPTSTPNSGDEHLEFKEIDGDAKGITREEFLVLEHDVNKAMRQHCSKMSRLCDKKTTLNTDRIIEENKTALLDTPQMIKDYQHTLKCNHISNKTLQGFSDKDQSWPSDEELNLIGCHLKLKRESVENMCKKLKIGYISADGRPYKEETVFGKFQEWRDRVAKKKFEEKHKQLSEAFESNNIRGLLPPLKGRLVYKAELVDFAFHLLIHEFLPIAEEWGVHAMRLISYRPAFKPFHLEIGTINLLSKLLKEINYTNLYFANENMRRIFLGELKMYRNVTIHGMIAYEMSYGELFRILEVMIQNTGVRSLKKGMDSYKIPDAEVKGGTSDVIVGPQIATYGNSSTKSTPKDVVEEVDIEKGEKEQLLEQPDNQDSELKVSEVLLVLQEALQLTDQDPSDGHTSAKPTNAYDMFKIWKEQPRSSVFNYRSALANQLRNMEMPSLADEIISGDYITEETSLEFIESMVQRLSVDQQGILNKLLKLSGKCDICAEICDWVADWTKEMKSSQHTYFLSRIIKSTDVILQRHRDLNDRLVEHGFLDLAREIMIIEQNIA